MSKPRRSLPRRASVPPPPRPPWLPPLAPRIPRRPARFAGFPDPATLDDESLLLLLVALSALYVDDGCEDGDTRALHGHPSGAKMAALPRVPRSLLN